MATARDHHHRRRQGPVVPDADRAHRAGREDAPSGALIEVLATDPGSVKDFAAWCRSTGNELVEQSVDGPVYRFVIRRK